MAVAKKGQLRQFMIPLYGTSDGNVKSAITESDFNSGATVKFFGCDNGTSAAFTSGTVSKAGRLVRSGVFQITLKGTENNYDNMTVRVNKTSVIEQIVSWENVDNDDSDIMSALTVIQSMASDAASAAQQGNSRVLLNQSRVSDIQSFLSDFQSDLLSLINTTGVNLNASVLSDLRSAITATELDASDLSDIASAVRTIVSSDLSDIISAVAVANSRVLLNQSRISDIQSFLSDFQSDLLSHIDTTGVQLNASSLSDIRSAIAANTVTLSASDISDIASAVAAAAGTLTASEISDIASAVRAILISDLSDIHSAATAGASRALINQSRVSDIQSFLSDLQSDLISHLDTTGVGLNASTMSDIRSAITATTFALSASDLSDIASAVRTVVSSDLSDIISAVAVANSRVLLNQSRISDVYSALVVMSGIQSDIYSAIAAGVEIGASSLSDLRSAITATELDASDLSDIASAVWARLGSDPTTVPAATGTMGAKVDWLTALSRNKLTQTATVQSLRNNADSADIASAAVSDDATTYSRNQWS